jgi:hypothetical protein
VGGVDLDSLSERELERLHAGGLKLASLDDAVLETPCAHPRRPPELRTEPPVSEKGGGPPSEGPAVLLRGGCVFPLKPVGRAYDRGQDSGYGRSTRSRV